MYFAKTIILGHKLNENTRHAPKTKLFTSHTKFGCSRTILHHFQSWSQPKRCRHQKKAARPNSYWVTARVHHMHGSVYSIRRTVPSLSLTSTTPLTKMQLAMSQNIPQFSSQQSSFRRTNPNRSPGNCEATVLQVRQCCHRFTVSEVASFILVIV